MRIPVLALLVPFIPTAWITEVSAIQNVFQGSHVSSMGCQWTAKVSDNYQVIGPFPQEAREQHFLNPGYPLESAVKFPVDQSQSFPSHLADSGFVYWKNDSARTELDSTLLKSGHRFGALTSVHYSVSFPEIRWDSIRATEGWAGLQHHALLHTTIKLIPPQNSIGSLCPVPTHLEISASQCSFISILDSRHGASGIPHWQACNIYAYSGTPSIRIPISLQDLSTNSSAEYVTSRSEKPMHAAAINIVEAETQELDVLMSLDYEIRLFGDPTVSSNSAIPTIQADLAVRLESNDLANISGETLTPDHTAGLIRESRSRSCFMAGNTTAHVFPHIVDGRAFGRVIGFEITSCSPEVWRLEGADLFSNSSLLSNLRINAREKSVFAPSQTRLLSFDLIQMDALPSSTTTLSIEISLTPACSAPVQQTYTVRATIPMVHHHSLSKLSDGTGGILLTYLTVSGAAASAVVIPPSSLEEQEVTHKTRILLAMHGAGVMHTSPFWLSALPRPAHAWLLVVQGLTPWGLDWREASRADVCSALRALVSLIQLPSHWSEEDYCTANDGRQSRGIHSYGPDSEEHPIPVIAIGHSNGGQGALQLASLFPDSVPALIPAAGYTSARLYISTQHSRGSLFADATLQAIMRASLQGQDGDLVAGNLALNRVHLVHGGDDENVPVWHSRERMALVRTWNPRADINMTEVPGKPHFWDTVFHDEPVLSAVNDLVKFPHASSSGPELDFTFTVVWPSESGAMHGWRVRELTVPGQISRIRVKGGKVKTTNVHALSVRLSKAELTPGKTIDIDGQDFEVPNQSHFWLRRGEDLQWKLTRPLSPRASGPLSSIFITPKPIVIVIPTQFADYYQSIALRIAHNLYTYLKIDCAILSDDKAQAKTLKDRHVVVVGARHNKYGLCARQRSGSPLQVNEAGAIMVSGRTYGEPGTAALCLYDRHLYMDAVDESGYERALRMFPLRTGVPEPEWMILGEECDEKGYAAALAAGFWSRTGEISPQMSYFT